MSYEIQTLNGSVETELNRTEALWTLGSRYGAPIVNRAKTLGAIVWHDDRVTVNDEQVQHIIAHHRKTSTTRI